VVRLVFFLVTVISQTDCHPHRTSKVIISDNDAKRLVFAALDEEARRLPGLTLSPQKDTRRPRCLTFDVLWDNPGIGSAHVDFYRVDLRTAVLWNPVLCNTSPSRDTARLQDEFRKQNGVSMEEVRDSIAKTACCP